LLQGRCLITLVGGLLREGRERGTVNGNRRLGNLERQGGSQRGGAERTYRRPVLVDVLRGRGGSVYQVLPSFPIVRGFGRQRFEGSAWPEAVATARVVLYPPKPL
jgi:hypothetical protein